MASETGNIRGILTDLSDEQLKQSERYLWDYQSKLMTSAYEESDSYDRALDRVTLRLSQVRSEIQRRKADAPTHPAIEKNL